MTPVFYQRLSPLTCVRRKSGPYRMSTPLLYLLSASRQLELHLSDSSSPATDFFTLESSEHLQSSFPLAARTSENAQAVEVAQEQASARAVLKEKEATASQQQLAREEELQQACRTVRLLEKGQVGSGAPSFAPTVTNPPQPRFTSQLPIGQPITPLPGKLRGPWAATRERLQETASPSPMVYPFGMSAPSSALPSLSGVVLLRASHALPLLHLLLLLLMHAYILTRNSPLNLASHMTRGRSTSRGKSLLYPNFRARVVTQLALPGQFMNGFNVHASP